MEFPTTTYTQRTSSAANFWDWLKSQRFFLVAENTDSESQRMAANHSKSLQQIAANAAVIYGV